MKAGPDSTQQELASVSVSLQHRSLIIIVRSLSCAGNSARGGDANVPTALRIVMTMTGVWPSESTGPGVIRTPRMTGVERILPGGEGCNDSEELSRAHVYVIDRSWIRGQPFHGFRLVGSLGIVPLGPDKGIQVLFIQVIHRCSMFPGWTD